MYKDLPHLSSTIGISPKNNYFCNQIETLLFIVCRKETNVNFLFGDSILYFYIIYKV